MAHPPDPALPAFAEMLPAGDSPQEGQTGVAELVDDLGGLAGCGDGHRPDARVHHHPTDLLEQARGARHARVHRAVEHRVVEAGRQVVALHRHPVPGEVDRLDLLNLERSDGVLGDRMPDPFLPDPAGDAVVGRPAGVAGVVNVTAFVPKDVGQAIVKRHSYRSGRGSARRRYPPATGRR